MTLDREQERIVREIKRQARARYADPRDRRLKVNAAIQTGLVETRLHNLRGGDADSVNWRQERASIYGGDMSIRRSVGRFFDEADQLADPGERSFEVAAQVQRPAAQYRGRYRDVRGEANAIRRGVTLSGRAGAAAAGGSTPPGFDPGSPEALAMLQRATPVQALAGGAGLPLPEAAAGPVMPEGYRQVQSSGGPSPAQETPVDLAQGQSVDFSSLVGDPRGARRAARDQLGLGGLRNAEGLTDELGAWAHKALGLKAGSRDRSPAENAAVGGAPGSDHIEVGGGDGHEAVDLPTTPAEGGWGQYRKVARKLGLKPAADGFTEGEIVVGGRRFRVQLIFGEKHGHGDHIHVGFKRAGR